MTPHDVLTECRRRRIDLCAERGKLKFKGPSGAVDPELKAKLVEHKPAILELLAPCPQCGKPLDVARCWGCHYRICEVCRVRNTDSAFIATCLACQFQSKGAV